MTSIIVAIVIGVIITFIEKSMGKAGKKSAPGERSRSARPVRAPKPPVAPVAPELVAPASPFLAGEQIPESIPVKDTQMHENREPEFTPKQQELRRTIILGEILRRKF